MPHILGQAVFYDNFGDKASNVFYMRAENATEWNTSNYMMSYVNGIVHIPEKPHQKYTIVAVDSLSSYFYKRLDWYYINFTLRVVT